MRVIIAGPRDYYNRETVAAAIKSAPFTITEVVSGGARGVDKMGEVYADACKIPLKQFIADWVQFGKPAGPIRNAEMADYADALIAVWDAKSTGTRNMIENMNRRGKPVHLFLTPDR